MNLTNTTLGLVSTFLAWGFSWMASRAKKYWTLVLVASLVINLVGEVVVNVESTKCPSPLVLANEFNSKTSYQNHYTIRWSLHALRLSGKVSCYSSTIHPPEIQFQAPYIIGLPMIQANTASTSKKTVANAIYYFAYAVSNTLGRKLPNQIKLQNIHVLSLL